MMREATNDVQWYVIDCLLFVYAMQAVSPVPCFGTMLSLPNLFGCSLLIVSPFYADYCTTYTYVVQVCNLWEVTILMIILNIHLGIHFKVATAL
jgi:hypothetical protein